MKQLLCIINYRNGACIIGKETVKYHRTLHTYVCILTEKEKHHTPDFKVFTLPQLCFSLSCRFQFEIFRSMFCDSLQLIGYLFTKQRKLKLILYRDKNIVTLQFNKEGNPIKATDFDPPFLCFFWSLGYHLLLPVTQILNILTLWRIRCSWTHKMMTAFLVALCLDH